MHPSPSPAPPAARPPVWFSRLHPRQQAALLGAVAGAVGLALQTRPPGASRYTRFKRDFHNGIDLGVGIGGGVIVTIGALQRLAELPLPLPRASRGTPPGAVALGAALAALTGIALRTSRALLLDLPDAPGAPPIGGRLTQFRRRTGLGLSIGAGLLVAGGALNWMVEEADSIAGEPGGGR